MATKGYVGILMSYTPVEYIESSGTQYIDTNISTNSNTKIEIEVQFNNANLQECIWCGRDFNSGGTGINNDTLFKFTNGIFRVDYSGIGTNFSHTVNTTTKYKYVQDKNLLYENNTLIYTSSSATFATTNKLRLFAARNRDGSVNNFFNGKVYSFKVYDNDTLVGDFIPAIDQDNVACLYEQVEGKLYYNKGTGNFTAGNTTGQAVSIGKARKMIAGDVGVSTSYTPVEYLESSGTQWINTGVTTDSTFKIDFDATIVSGNANVWMPVWGTRTSTTADYCALYVNTDTHYLSPNYAGFDPRYG